MGGCHIGYARMISGSIKWVFISLWSDSKWYISGAAAIHLFEALLPVVHIYLAKELIDSLVAIMQHEKEMKSQLINAALILIIQSTLSLATVGMKHLGTILMMKFNHRVTYKFDEAVLRKCNALPLVYFDIPDFHNTIMRASNGIGSKMLELLFGGLRILKSAITLTGFLYIFYSVHWGLFVLILLMFLPSLKINIWGSNIKFEQNKARTTHSRRLAYIYETLKNREAAKELRMFDHFLFLFEKWKLLFQEDFKVKYLTEKNIMKYSFFVELTNTIVSAINIAFFFWLFYTKELTLGEFTSYSTIIFQIFSMFQAL
ncbi:MAG: putative transporter ATP-binding protein, partial [Paenibacillus sp.]|nr:putative transporter ATP-binding protein [Paenibacillus sp.]